MSNTEQEPWEGVEKTNKNRNYFTGVIGALLGSLLGAVVLVLFDRLGYVSAISGLAIAFFAARGYKLLGGPINKVMPFIIAIMVIIGTFVGVLASAAGWGVTDYGMTVGEAVQTVFSALFTSPDFLQEMLMASLLPLLFSAIGAWATIRQLYKEAADFKKTGVVPGKSDETVSSDTLEQ